MTFDDFKSGVLHCAYQATAYSLGAPPDGHDDERATKVVAAAAIVMQRKGRFWCRTNPQAFRSEVLDQLGTWVKIAMAIGGIFGGGTWVALVGWLLPAVIQFINTHLTLDTDLESIATGAATAAGVEVPVLVKEWK